MIIKKFSPLAFVFVVSVAFGASPPVTFHFDTDPADKPPAGWTSYATGGGPAGNWVVKAMPDAPSGKQVVEQIDADATGTRFPVLVANDGEYSDLDVSVKGKALSGKVDQGIGLVFRFRDPKSYYVIRANALENNVRLIIKLYVPKESPIVPTLTALYASANWMEREAFDFYGITFTGHPRMERILNMEDMDYHPMRKEYPLEDATREDKIDALFGR